MRRADASEALGLGFDHLAKGIPTERALLLKVEPDGFEVVVGQGFVEQLAVGFGALCRCRGERCVLRMRREDGFVTEPTMAGAARPWVGEWIIRHMSADGIELDIAVAMQKVAFAIDQACLVATFPQCSGAPVTCVELAHVATSKFLHEASKGSDFGWRGQQVDVVVHQDVRVQLAACFEQCFAQQGQVTLSIFIVEKAGQAIVPSLDNVLRNSGQVESWLSGHRLSVGASVPAFQPPRPLKFVGVRLSCVSVSEPDPNGTSLSGINLAERAQVIDLKE